MSGKDLILVTGGAGYIGSHTVIELLEADCEVISIDNFSNSSPEAYARVRQITGKDFTSYDIDLCDEALVEKAFSAHPGISGIIHFAAYKSVPESVAKPELYFKNNIGSLRNVLKCAAAHGVDQFIFSSSCSVYGNISELPVSETTPLQKAESPYAQTKKDGEDIVCEATQRVPGFKAIALRYFNPVGAHPSGLNGELPLSRPNNLVPVITQTAAGKLPSFTVFGNDYDTRDGTCIRDYVHVCDIARAHVLALGLLKKKTGPHFDLINLGTGAGVTVLEAIKAFEEVSGVRPNYTIGPRREGDVAAIYSDCMKAEKLLGWKTKYDLEDMMSSAWKWQMNLERRER